MKKFINLLNDKMNHPDIPLSEEMMVLIKTTQQGLQEHEQRLEENNNRRNLYNPGFYQPSVLSKDVQDPRIAQGFQN